MSPLALSAAAATASVAASLPLAVGAAWVLERTRWKGRGLLHAAALLPLVLPPVVTGYLLLEIFSPRRALGATLEAVGLPVAFHFMGAVVAAAVVGFPLFLTGTLLAFQAVDARLEDQARTLGLSRSGAFFRVTLPLSWPGVLAGAVVAFARALGEFGATIVLAGRVPGKTETLPLAIFAALERPGGEGEAAVLAWTAAALGVAALGAARLLAARFRRTVEGRR